MRHSKGKQQNSMKNKILLLLVLLAMIVLALFCFVRVARSFAKISSMDIDGVCSYSSAELAGAAGIKVGDRMFAFDKSDAEEAILKECPYVKEVNISRSLFGGLTFEVTEKEPVWYIEMSDSFFVLDSDLRVIEENIYEDALRSRGVTKLVLPRVTRLVEGEIVSFGADENEIIKSCEIIVAVTSSEMKSRMTLLDIESRFDINAVLDGTFEVYLGDNKDLEAKFTAIKNLLSSDKASGAVGGKIDASNPEMVFFERAYE